MPRQPRGEEIVEAIRQYLKGAAQDSEPITDGLLMGVAKCSRAPFYKYVTKDSQIRREIGDARAQQKKKSRAEGRGPAEPDHAAINTKLRGENEELKVALRGLEAYVARLISNLTERGVSATVLQAAQTDAMSKPDRRYPTRGRSRSRKKHRQVY
jgi:hypothetical protein